MAHKLYVFGFIVLFVLLSVCTIGNAQTTMTTAEDKTIHFITDVMNIDTSKYELTSHSYTIVPSTLGGSVKQENVRLVLNSSGESAIRANFIFQNGYIYGADFQLFGQIVKNQNYNSSTLEKMNAILVRYQNFSTTLGVNADELPSALYMLSSVTELSTSSKTEGNIKMKITQVQPNVFPDLDYSTSIAWVYTDNGVDNTWKCLSLGFNCLYGTTQVSFSDTWGLFSVDSTVLPCISEAEAQDIAWNVAKDYEIKLLNAEDNSTCFVKPVWPAVVSVESSMSMVPGGEPSESLVDGSVGGSFRDALVLYPLWKFLFYFDEPVGGAVGLQVGVWGDTKEVAYCSTYGFYGVPVESASPSLVVSPQSTAPPLSPSGSLIIVLVVGLVIVVSIGALTVAIWVKRRKRT